MHTEQTNACIDATLACYRSCTEHIEHCLEKGGKHTEAPHLALLIDCAAICNTTTDFMLRGSQYQKGLCAMCATICDACATDCDRFDDDEEMKQCADVCRRCADACKKMA